MAFGKLTLDWRSTIAATWRSNRNFLKPIKDVDLVNPDLLVGIDDQKEAIFSNTERFLRGKTASHALLWGISGGGKASLIKAILSRYHTYGLRMIQISRNDLHVLIDIIDEVVTDSHHRFIIYCDNLPLDGSQEGHYVLKNVMEGSLEKPPANVLIYATSNCWISSGEGSVSVAPRAAPPHAPTPIPYCPAKAYRPADEGIAELVQAAEDDSFLTDCFGLTLAFPPMSQESYLKIIDRLFKGRVEDAALLHEEALNFARYRGGHTGRTARHFFSHCQSSL